MARKIFFSGLKGGTGKKTINKLCIMLNMRIGNEKLSKKEDFVSLKCLLELPQKD